MTSSPVESIMLRLVYSRSRFDWLGYPFLAHSPLYFPVHTILSPHLGQNFQSDLVSEPHFLHFTTAAITGISYLLSFLLNKSAGLFSLLTHSMF